MSRNKLRIGVIGVGYVASNNFLPVFPRFDDVELAGIMANHLESAKKAQRLCGAQQVVQSLEELVKLDLDCAFVLTPKACHAEQISFLLKAGIDVYSEKPMATTLKDADHMAELSEQTGRKLMIGFNRRYAPVCQKAKEVYTDLRCYRGTLHFLLGLLHICSLIPHFPLLYSEQSHLYMVHFLLLLQ